jgi:phage N-6-adenine-methyltransferase
VNTNLMFSSDNGKWETPASLVADLSTVFDWDIDVCAERPNVCQRFYSPEDNGLARDWRGLWWCNPPYGRDIRRWIGHAHDSTTFLPDGSRGVMLVPARTDTAWWQNHIPHCFQIVHIRGRLTFGSDEYWLSYWAEYNAKDNNCVDPYMADGVTVRKNAAPFPSAFLVFGEITYPQMEKLATYGYSITLHDRLPKGDNNWTHRQAVLTLPIRN